MDSMIFKGFTGLMIFFRVYFFRSLKNITENISDINMGVSKNRGTTKSSILIRFSLINHPFWGFTSPIFGNTHMNIYEILCNAS